MDEINSDLHIPTDAERIANHQALAKLHRGNRFRLMFGLPLLPEPQTTSTTMPNTNTTPTPETDALMLAYGKATASGTERPAIWPLMKTLEQERNEMRDQMINTFRPPTPTPPNQTQDAARYRKLKEWMSSNVPEGWKEVENLGGIACHAGSDDFDAYLDSLPECNVGLCYKRPTK